jgi:hypothetical protein
MKTTISASWAHQFQNLIIEPIHSTTSKVISSFNVLSHLAKQKIFVIDAFDECNDKAEMTAFINALLTADFRSMWNSQKKKKGSRTPESNDIIFHMHKF